MVDTFQRESLKDGFYIIERVEQFKFLPVLLYGMATITHVGGNGRFKFLLDGETYISRWNGSICTDRENGGANKESDRYFDYSQVVFDRDIKEEWSKLYIYHEDKNGYWKAI